MGNLGPQFDFTTPNVHSQHTTARVHHLDDHRFYVANLITDVNHRGEGHGSKFVSDLSAAADRQGHTLATHPGNADLVPFYQRHGFKESNREQPLNGQPYMERPPTVYPKSSEHYARQQGFKNQADMRGEDW